MNKSNLFALVLAGVLSVACGGTQTRESTGEYFDDTAITTKVKTQLLTSRQTTGTAISVETFKGTVQLGGFVDSEAEKLRAGEIAAAVAGVKEVENRISVKKP